MAVPWPRRLVAGLSPRRPAFDLGLVYVGFVANKVALRQFPADYYSLSLSVPFYWQPIFTLNLILLLPREEEAEPWWPSETPTSDGKWGIAYRKSTWTSSEVKKLVSQRRTTEHCGREEVYPRHIKQIVDLNLGSKTKHLNMYFVSSFRLFSQVPKHYEPRPF